MVRRILVDRMQRISSLDYDNFRDSLLGIEMLKTCFKQLWLDCFMSIKKGCTIEPETYILLRVLNRSQDGKDDAADAVDLNANYTGTVEQNKEIPDDCVNLGIIARKGVPLVLNFGSCS